MSKHLFATIVTPTAATITEAKVTVVTLSTLQKITAVMTSTTVCAEAIRWGLREYFQNSSEKM